MSAFSGPAGAPPSLPPGERVYAVGDIHGRLDLLERMLTLVEEDLAARPHPAPTEVFLGDYVDRGPDSAGVIDRLSGPPGPGRRRVCLRGNHEEAFLAFIEDAAAFWPLIDFGGAATLSSYGVPDHLVLSFADPAACRRLLRERLPERHLAFLRGLGLYHLMGDILFVHAGVMPGVPLERQSARDLVWIRDRFLRDPAPFPGRVVHGHTPVGEPTVLPHRLGIDTGAFASGRLTCAVLEGTDVRFLTASAED